MGIWSTMPLLSTLAALVIIVHSAEEQRGYRRDLRPRTVDTASYEQPWRAIDSEPLVQPSTRAEAWNDSPEEIPERRRLVRKRKRRPHPYPDGEPQERYQESIQGTYQDHHDPQQTPDTRKRRKRPDFNYQTPDEPARPVRRRGIRRKRPMDYDTLPPELAGLGTDDDDNQRPQNYSKYNQYNEYDDMEQTEKTKLHSTSTTDNLANQPYALDNAEYADMSAYNRPVSSQEEHNRFVIGNTRSNGVYMHPFHESSSSGDESFPKVSNSAVNGNTKVNGIHVDPFHESSNSADDDSHERSNIHQETNKPASESIVTKAESDPDNNAKIMMMIKKSKVKNGTIGITFTGNFSVSVPAEIANTDYNYLPTTEGKSKSITFNGTGINYSSFPILANLAYADYSVLPAATEKSKPTIINVTKQNYFLLPIPAEVPYTVHHGLPATEKKTNTVMAQTINDTNLNHRNLSKPAEVPCTDYKLNHSNLSKPAELPCTDYNGLPATTAKSNTTIANGTEQDYFPLSIPTEALYDDNNDLFSTKDKSNTIKFNGTTHNYIPLTLSEEVYHGLPATEKETNTVMPQTIDDTKLNHSNLSKPAEVPCTDYNGSPATTAKSNTTIANGTEQDYFPLSISTEALYVDNNDLFATKDKSNTIQFYGKRHNYIPLPLSEEVANTNNNVLLATSEKSNATVNNTTTTIITTTSMRTTTTITNPLEKIPTEKLNGVNYSEYDDELTVYTLTTEPTAKTAATKLGYDDGDRSKNVIKIDYGIKGSKYIYFPKSKQYFIITYDLKNNEPAAKTVTTNLIYNVEKSRGVLNLDYDRKEPHNINLAKSKQDAVISYGTSKNKEPVAKIIATTSEYNIQKSKEPKYFLPRSIQYADTTYGNLINIEPKPKTAQTALKYNTEKSGRLLSVDYSNIEPKYLNWRKLKQDVVFTYGTSKNNEPLAKNVASTSIFAHKSRGEINLDYRSKYSKYKKLKLVLPKSKKDVFAYGPSKNDEPREEIDALASYIYSKENNGIANVDYGSIKSKYNYLAKSKQDVVIASETSKNKDFTSKKAATDLKNLEKSNYVINHAFKTKESKKAKIEKLHGIGSFRIRYNIKKKPKYFLRTQLKKTSHFWDIVHKKWINTDKWIPNIKLQIPRITPSLEEEFEENGAINPLMLKQILKRSNGTSLSEILQQHNLSLTDLLQGKNEAISALNISASKESKSQFHDTSLEKTPQLNEAESKYTTVKQKSSEKKVAIESSSDEDTNETTTPMLEHITEIDDSEIENQTIKPRMTARRRFPNGIRRKLRMRPMLNSTLKAQLSRDLIALTAKKYSHHNRNVTKSREWKEIVPMMVDRSTDKMNRDDATETTVTTTDVSIDTTIPNLETFNSSYSLSSVPDTSNVQDNEVENTAITTTEATTTITIEVTPPFEIINETEKPKVTPIVRPAANNSVLRRQAFNNRLKRKRLKQKSTTENPQDDLMKNFLGMANLVSASQFIERTQKPYTTKQENTEYATELEDFMTTKTPATEDGGIKSTLIAISSSTSTTRNLPQTSTSTTEQSAKFEIEEILNDTMTSERLAKILRDRNMTLSELVNHRERGSSHVHLADIFHNASKEPNPPEPFLTKSSIEPISKETYPLRAILEANTHETTTRSSSHDQKSYVNIPVVMDFGNNVNENGESMGIISLFNKLTDSEITVDKTQIRKDSDGTPYVSSVIRVNATANDTNRESRVLDSNDNWNELLSFMKEHNISTFEEDLQALNKEDTEKDSIEDLDGDGLMILDDMQHLQNFESNIAPGSDENIEIKMFERREHLSEKPGILNKLPSNTKSVAIATASILGLAAILFLLTYIAFKWKQQRNKLRKKESFCVDQIPSPVFENRKSHKNNCSSRSISPMISNTNIYMSTLESHNGKESPDYMWNSLRKPFQ